MIRNSARSDHGLHSYGKNPHTYNGRNVINTIVPSFLIGSSSFLQVTRICMKAWVSVKLCQIQPLTTELAALEALKNQCIML